MATAATKNPFFSLFSKPKKADDEKPYRGVIQFNKNTIQLRDGDMTILRHNITHVEVYGLKKVYKIPTALYWASIIATIITLLIGISVSQVLIITLFTALIALMGFLERRRPDLTGLTIELTSGFTYTFYNENRAGIVQLYKDVSEALELGITLTATFAQNNITIDKSIHTHIGGNADGINIHGADSVLHKNS